MFLFTRSTLKSSLGDKKLFRMGDFYKFSRKSQNILLDSNGKPVGGKWSFDEENRKKIPNSVSVPELSCLNSSKYHKTITDLIVQHRDNRVRLSWKINQTERINRLKDIDAEFEEGD